MPRGGGNVRPRWKSGHRNRLMAALVEQVAYRRRGAFVQRENCCRNGTCAMRQVAPGSTSAGDHSDPPEARPNAGGRPVGSGADGDRRGRCPHGVTGTRSPSRGRSSVRLRRPYCRGIIVWMKKTLHIDESLLRDARSASGAKTDTDTVRLGLEALVRRGAYERLRALRGSEPRARNTRRRRERAAATRHPPA